MLKKWSMYIAIAVWVFMMSGAVQSSDMQAAASPLASSDAQTLQQQVNVWKEAIAKQELFEEWHEATVEVSPLGPGTHSWLALLMKHGQPVGYMVIHARQDGGYVLGEYGLGESPLFSASTLHRALVQYELITDTPTPHHLTASLTPPVDYTAQPIYYGPLHAVWKVSLASGGPALFFDGMTGEQLPYEASLPGNLDNPDKAPCPLAATAGKEAVNSTNSGRIQDSKLLAAFDPYASFPWLTQPPLKDNKEQLTRTIGQGKQQLIYSAEPWDNALRYVWSIRGYHRWESGALYIAADHNGLRYIPAQQYIIQGSFYLLG